MMRPGKTQGADETDGARKTIKVAFYDSMSTACSVEESVLGEGDRRFIWLGRDENPRARMFLSQADVRYLLPILARYAETGELLG